MVAFGFYIQFLIIGAAAYRIVFPDSQNPNGISRGCTDFCNSCIHFQEETLYLCLGVFQVSRCTVIINCINIRQTFVPFVFPLFISVFMLLQLVGYHLKQPGICQMISFINQINTSACRHTCAEQNTSQKPQTQYGNQNNFCKLLHARSPPVCPL